MCKFSCRRSRTVIAVLILSLLSAPVGCSRSSKKTETTTVTESPTGSGSTVETHKTEKSEESSSSSGGCSGVLSCTVDTLGTVIAFPFKVVGSLFEAIF